MFLSYVSLSNDWNECFCVILRSASLLSVFWEGFMAISGEDRTRGVGVDVPSLHDVDGDLLGWGEVHRSVVPEVFGLLFFILIRINVEHCET